MKKMIPFTLDEINELKKNNPTPFYIYDKQGIVNTINDVNKAFAWNEGFKEHFAVKALPNPNILKLLKENGAGSDCASIPEIKLSKLAGIDSDDIIFTSNQTTIEEYKEALANKIIINLDAIEQLHNLELAGDIPDKICLRFNPGEFKFSNSLIGELKNSKFGMTKSQLFEAIAYLKDKGVKHFGIHSMLAGNILDEDYYPCLAELLFNLCIEIKEKFSIKVEFLDFAGGVGIPYKDEQTKVDIYKVAEKVHELYDKLVTPNGLKIAIHCEMGRYITGPFGYLVTSVINIKETYKKYIGVDAAASNLMRPAMYGSYHKIINMNNVDGNKELVDVVGPLCENNDKFAVDRMLEECKLNDILVLCDAGAHSHSMGYQYNGRLRSAEFLYDNHEFKMIRRKETFEDYIATVVTE